MIFGAKFLQMGSLWPTAGLPSLYLETGQVGVGDTNNAQEAEIGDLRSKMAALPR